MNYNNNRLEEFWYYVNERQEIFKRRHVLEESPPWTEDSILQEKRFTNVYRELDRVTRYYIDNYVDEGYEPRSLFLTTFLFRIFNNTDTMELIGVVSPETYNGNKLTEIIENKRDQGLQPFNSAYMIAANVYPDFSSKVAKYLKGVFGQELVPSFDEYWSPVKEDASPKEFIESWKNLSGVHDFIAYEVYTDLTYHEWFPFDENDYVNVGPGAERGINRLFGKDKNANLDINYVDIIHDLRDMQEEYLREDFYKWKGRDLSLRAIEHSLCEFDKYRRCKVENETSRLQNFNPPDV